MIGEGTPKAIGNNMKLKQYDEYLVDSIPGHCDGPSEVDSGSNTGATVIQVDSTARQKKVVDAVLRHCRAAKEQNAALGIGV